MHNSTLAREPLGQVAGAYREPQQLEAARLAQPSVIDIFHSAQECADMVSTAIDRLAQLNARLHGSLPEPGALATRSANEPSAPNGQLPMLHDQVRAIIQQLHTLHAGLDRLERA